MWQQWLNGILGIWVIVAAWSYMSSGTGRTLLIITGIVVAILGFWGASMSPTYRGSSRPGQM
ncbi:MAG: hypothetical protein M1383_04825 [Patescibacteria group bacterium]|nr:hypothetical protein [Patescibacteria group bacterium]